MSKLTTHAVVFLALTGFTVTAAVVFQNPLLVYTALFMATSNVVLYIWAQASVRGLKVRRIHGTTAVATHPCEIELELYNERNTIRYGTLGFDLHANLAPGQDYTPVAFLVAKPAEPVRAGYIITPPRRGVLKLGPFYLYGGDPFGFYKCWRKLPVTSELTVLPCPVSFHFSRPASTSMLAQDDMETVANPGESTEFLGVREYREGEALKRVHWRTSARLGKLISRQFELNVAASISTLLLVDQAMLTGGASETPLEFAVTVIASLGNATHLERFHFSHLALTGARYDTVSGTGRRFYQELALHLARLEGQGPVDWEGHAKKILTYLPRTASLIVFLAELSESTRERLRQLAVHFRSLVVVSFNLKSFERAKRPAQPGPRLYFGESYLVFEVFYGDEPARVLEQILAKPALLRSRR